MLFRMMAEIGTKLGKKALAVLAKNVKPETLLAWHRKHVEMADDPMRHAMKRSCRFRFPVVFLHIQRIASMCFL